jgi:hypothetical protein
VVPKKGAKNLDKLMAEAETSKKQQKDDKEKKKLKKKDLEKLKEQEEEMKYDSHQIQLQSLQNFEEIQDL